MNLLYKVILDKEFDQVPSRSERARVVVAVFEDEEQHVAVQYAHHEGVSLIVGTESDILTKLKANFESSMSEYPGTELMIATIAQSITDSI